MRMTKFLVVAAMAVLIPAATASATFTVWFEATPTNALSSVTIQGGPGVSTVLGCDSSVGGRCEWNIDIRLTNDVGFFGWWTTLTGGTPGKLAAKQVDFTGSPLGAGFDSNFVGGAPLIADLGQSTFAAAIAPGTYTLAHLLLSKDKLPGDTNTEFINAGQDANSFGWGDDAFGFGEVVYGGNNPIGGDPGAGAPNPVITINNIPEPGTIALLAVGALGLIRRRR